MVDTYMLTAPRDEIHKADIKQIIRCNDCKRWIVAKETGENGYEHWQIRLSTSNTDFFNWIKTHYPGIHIDKATSSDFQYEKKSGYYWSSDDSSGSRPIRFGTPTDLQRRILGVANNQGDRGITCILDPVGCHGKTWLTIHLWERGIGLPVPRTDFTPVDMSAFVCSAYRNQQYIIVDVPRAKKIKPEMYESLEELKDGLVYDKRYSGKIRNIRGAKIIVFTNNPLDTSQLSKDRWHLYGISNKEEPSGVRIVTLTGAGYTWSYRTKDSRSTVGKRIQT